jgi:hypothetical protein
MQAARDAQLSAELAQAALNDAAQKTDLVPGAPADLTPPETVSTTFPGEAPAEVTGQPTTFTPPAELPSIESVDGALQPSTIGGMLRDEAGTAGGLGTLSTDAGAGQVGGVPGDVSGGLPSGLPGGDLQGVAGGAPGGIDTGLPGGAEEGIPQLPPVEVIGEEEDERYIGQRFPLTRPSRTPIITYNYLGEPSGRRIVRRSPLMSLLGATGTDRGALGDLGSGVTFIDQPIEFLQPSMLAHGGLIRFRRT